jgi:hypothetical protein
MGSDRSIVVEHLPHHPNAEGSSPGARQWQKIHLKQRRIWSTARSSSIMEEHLPRHPKAEGSSPGERKCKKLDFKQRRISNGQHGGRTLASASQG